MGRELHGCNGGTIGATDDVGGSRAVSRRGNNFSPLRYRDVVLQDSPVGYWRLGELSGSTAVDDSGSGFDLTYTDSPTLGVGGLIASDSDTAVEFTNKACARGTISTLSLSSWTVEAWLNINGKGDASYNRFVDVQDGSNGNSINLYWDEDDFIYGLVSSIGNARISNGFPLNQIVHLVATFDGSQIVLYKDGVSSATTAASGTLYPGAVSIGRRYDTSKDWINGTVDEVVLYDHALTATRVQAHYDAGTP